MTVSIANFRLRFPEFSDDEEFVDDLITMMIEDSEVYIGVDENHWKGQYDRAQAFLVAHLLNASVNTAYGDSNTKAGTVSNKTAGGVSVTRAFVTKDRNDLDDFLISSAYGQRFITIRNSCFIPIVVAVCR